jgi:hypothetical protein
MKKIENIKKLVEEAFDSYKIYLEVSGVLVVPEAKLALLKWPDIAQIAIECIGSMSGDKLDLLYADLCIAVVIPLEKIFEATTERLVQLTGQTPAGVKDIQHMLANRSIVEPIGLKRHIVRELNKMFVTLQTLTGVEYPSLKEK